MPPTNSGPIFDARRVKAPELRGLDPFVNGICRLVQKPHAGAGATQGGRRSASRSWSRRFTSSARSAFAKRLASCRELARLNRLEGAALERGLALAREAAWRALGMRPFPVQLIGALAMCEGTIAEMATGEGKTLTASLAASIWAWAGRPVHVITVNDYLVARDAEEMGPVYQMLGLQRRPRHP